MCLRKQQALYPDIGDVAIRVGLGYPVGARAVRVGVIDVVAGGRQIEGAELMVQTAQDDVSMQGVGAAAHVIVGVRDGALPVRLRKIVECRHSHRVQTIAWNQIVEKRLASGSRAAGRIVNGDRISAGVTQVREIAPPVEQRRDGGRECGAG